jgi:hypothetical protein
MKILTFVAAGLLVSTAALAQSDGQSGDRASGTQTSQGTAAENQANAPLHGADLRKQMRDNLQSEGFSDVKIVPDSFLVQAKDKSGHPVTMFINPTSMTEIVSEGSAPVSGMTSSANETFTKVPVTDRLASDIIGLPVYDQANQDIGKIKNIAYTRAGVQAYILSVGGFLGMGDHEVAVTPQAVRLSFDHAANTWHAQISTTEAALKSAPQYTPPSEG